MMNTLSLRFVSHSIRTWFSYSVDSQVELSQLEYQNILTLNLCNMELT